MRNLCRDGFPASSLDLVVAGGSTDKLAMERLPLRDSTMISMGFIWDSYGISMGFIWDLYGIYMGFI